MKLIIVDSSSDSDFRTDSATCPDKSVRKYH